MSSAEKPVTNRENCLLLPNPHIHSMEEDILHHFALGTKSHDLKAMFGDVKFVCVGGSPRRMHTFAEHMKKELGYKMPAGQGLVNIARATDRYAMYKVEPVLSVSHGMGVPSVSIMMHEIIKLLYHAGVGEVYFFRIGTSGGLGLQPGSVVVTEEAVDPMMRAVHETVILGQLVSRPAVLDAGLVSEIVGCASPQDGFATVKGKTMCTNDFYEGQGRLDGASCHYTEADKMASLRNINKQGVLNIEMECVCFAAMCQHANVKGAIVCVTLIDRLQGDQVTTPHKMLAEWGQRPAVLVGRFIKKKLGIQ